MMMSVVLDYALFEDCGSLSNRVSDLKFQLKQVKEKYENIKTMMTYANERITTLDKDLVGAKATSKKAWQERDRLLGETKSLETDFQSQRTKLGGVEAQLSGIKMELKEARIERLLFGD